MISPETFVFFAVVLDIFGMNFSMGRDINGYMHYKGYFEVFIL